MLRPLLQRSSVHSRCTLAPRYFSITPARRIEPPPAGAPLDPHAAPGSPAQGNASTQAPPPPPPATAAVASSDQPRLLYGLGATALLFGVFYVAFNHKALFGDAEEDLKRTATASKRMV